MLMKRLALAPALLAAGLLSTTAALAQNGPAAPAKPTVKDRLDKAVSTVTGDPMARADLDMKHVLDGLKSLDPKPIEDLSPEEARKQPTVADGVRVALEKQGQNAAPPPGVATRDISYKTAAGDMKARVYTPEGASGPLPVVVYYHGGGWVIADIDVYDATPRAIARMANAIVVSAEYRHAPEHKFPAAHEDAVDAYKWVLDNAGQFGGDPKRVAVLGESAGGNLAINVAIAARDQNLQPPLHQVLVYPVAGIDMATPSYEENEDAKPLNKAMMAWFVGHVIKSDADKQDPRIDLVGKAELGKLPAATIILAEIDPLRSDGERLAEKLQKAGVPVKLQTYPGVTHEFFGAGAAVKKAKDAEMLAAGDLKAAFSEQATGSVTGGAAKPAE